MPEIELLSSPATVMLVEQARSCPVTILEDVTIQDAADLQLVHTTCSLRPSECRAIHGKVVLKGEAAIQCIALQEDGSARILTSNTPFTQILEMPEIDEGDTVAARMAAREVDCRLEPDGLLSYTISAAAVITMRRMRTIQQIDDLYLPGRQLQIQEEKVLLHSMPAQTPFAGEVTEAVQTAQHVSRVVSASAVCCGAKCSAEGTLQLTAAVQVLYCGDDQQLCAVQRTLPLSVPCTVSGELSQIELAARAASSGENGILLTVSVSGAAAAEERTAFRHITALEEGEEQQAKDGITLVLRYIEQEQPLWEIAKSCGTTMEAIRRANELAADAVNVSNTMLLIPIQA